MIEYVRVRDKDTQHEYSVVDTAVNAFQEVLENEPAAALDGTPLPPKYHVPPETSEYADYKVDTLRDEVDKRNADRDEDHQIVVAEPGNKPQLIEALLADDQSIDGL